MKIELKRFEYDEKLSEESNAFSADLMIDGKKTGIASNNGQGSATKYYPLDEAGKQLIKQAEDYSKKLPADVLKSIGAKYGVEMTLEKFIDHLVHQQIAQKDVLKIRAKVVRAMENSVVFGVEDKSFNILGFKVPIGMLLVHPNGHEVMKGIITKRVLPFMQDYEKILNTNIPESLLKECGLREEQYCKPVEEVTKEKKQNLKAGRKI